MYVWLEALTSYISSIGYGQEDDQSKALLNQWWPAETQIVGKDNLRFHAAIWPGMLLSAGLELPKEIFIHGFVNVEGQKISKTVGNVIAPQTVVEKYGVDPVRYFFLREFPSQEDGDFSYKKMEERYNGDLANGLGNLIQRVATLVDNNLDGKLDFNMNNVSDIGKIALERSLSVTGDVYIKNFELHKTLEQIWKLISMANVYIDERKPWKEVKENPKMFLETMTILIAMIHHVTWLLQPFIPETSEKIKNIFNLPNSKEIPSSHEDLYPSE